MTTSHGTPAVFLDRDGTINEDVGYLTDLAELHIYPFAPDAIRLLRRAGFAIVVVTNQGGVARGVIAESLVQRTHEVMAERLTLAGAPVDAWYYCPHHPESVVPGLGAACECRKPGTGLPRASGSGSTSHGRGSWAITGATSRWATGSARGRCCCARDTAAIRKLRGPTGNGSRPSAIT
jgi:histidinol-phosphate phosphatase family protein